MNKQVEAIKNASNWLFMPHLDGEGPIPVIKISKKEAIRAINMAGLRMCVEIHISPQDTRKTYVVLKKKVKNRIEDNTIKQ